MFIDKTFFSTFRKGSLTYFYSSLFFPMYIRKKVFILYGFVRKTDNFVDIIPKDHNGFYEFKKILSEISKQLLTLFPGSSIGETNLLEYIK